MPIFFEPWKGSEYERSRPRLLLLGESHYGEIATDPEATRFLTGAYASNEWNHRFWTGIMQVVAGAPKDQIDRSVFWSDVSLYNYVQGSAGPIAGRAPPRDLWHSSEEAFFRVLERLQPDRVLVLSRRLWRNMSGRGAAGPHLELDGATHDTWIYDYEGGSAIASWIPHPSYGLSWPRWHPVVAALMGSNSSFKPKPLRGSA